MDDVISILESAPVQPDRVSQITVVQVMNRAPMAHLSIERALKFLLRKHGIDLEDRTHKHHDLRKHLETLRHCDTDTAAYLEHAFNAATSFYNLNANRPELKHLQSLGSYFSEVGTARAFETMRYWEIDQSPDDLIGQIWLPLHLEILRALRGVYLYEDEKRRHTVVDRVERAVREAMWSDADLAYVPGSAKEVNVSEYIAWLRTHATFRRALGEAIRSGFSIGNQFMNKTVAQAYEILRQSKDPAVLYLTTRLDVLPPQPRDFIPEVEWLGPVKERSGMVKTPSGHNLGFIDRSADGLWHITPSRDGPVSVAARAKSQTDARCYLAQLLTGPATLTAAGIGKTARLVGEGREKIQLNYEWERAGRASEIRTISWSHKLEFWDTDHEIQVGQAIRVEVKDDDGDNVVYVLEGDVTDVDAHVVCVVGHDYLDLAMPGERVDDGQADDD